MFKMSLKTVTVALLLFAGPAIAQIKFGQKGTAIGNNPIGSSTISPPQNVTVNPKLTNQGEVTIVPSPLPGQQPIPINRDWNAPREVTVVPSPLPGRQPIPINQDWNAPREVTVVPSPITPSPINPRFPDRDVTIVPPRFDQENIPTPPPGGIIPSPPIQPGPVSDYQRIGAREDILNPQARNMDALLVNPADNRQVLVRFTGGGGKGYRLRIRETPTRVYVELQEGRLPEASGYYTLLPIRYELMSFLNSPLGTRALVQYRTDRNPGTNPGGQDQGQTGNPGPVAVGVAAYQNLALDQAILKAMLSNKPYRISRINGNSFPMTRDLRPNRLTFEVDNGVVTRCTAG